MSEIKMTISFLFKNKQRENTEYLHFGLEDKYFEDVCDIFLFMQQNTSNLLTFYRKLHFYANV